jgi:hypothetical protein
VLTVQTVVYLLPCDATVYTQSVFQADVIISEEYAASTLRAQVG